jgi:hypothetical protein
MEAAGIAGVRGKAFSMESPVVGQFEPKDIAQVKDIPSCSPVKTR